MKAPSSVGPMWMSDNNTTRSFLGLGQTVDVDLSLWDKELTTSCVESMNPDPEGSPRSVRPRAADRHVEIAAASSAAEVGRRTEPPQRARPAPHPAPCFSDSGEQEQVKQCS